MPILSEIPDSDEMINFYYIMAQRELNDMEITDQEILLETMLRLSKNVINPNAAMDFISQKFCY